MMREGKSGGIEFNGWTIGNPCERLSAIADRDIVDRTGITGMGPAACPPEDMWTTQLLGAASTLLGALPSVQRAPH
jgi:hypothetical protein